VTDIPALQARQDLQDFLDSFWDSYWTADRPCRVLDAGCGGAVRLRLPEGAEITGIDISPESAARNTTIADIIIGDVQTYPLPRDAFDIVICWELLEHVQEPRAALTRFVKTLRRDGLIILAIPNPFSLKGLITKASPHTLHVWILRHILKQKNAGRPGFAPFPVHLRTDIAPSALERFFLAHNMSVRFLRLYEGKRLTTLRQHAPWLYYAYRACVSALNLATLKRHDFGASDMLLVVRANAN
jgi:2-polyprenyl-3-methyl-5-hydroxy-6-metoxy-1,4-benzoquinol methylase